MTILFFIPGCNEEKAGSETFSVKFGTECGWCAGQEYITLSGSEIKYERNIPCDENKGITQKSKPFSASEWETLLASFDYTLFKTLEYSDCNVCADGCDEIIEITDGDLIHELRYSPAENVEGMEDLKEILSGLMEEMRAMD